MVKTYGVDQSVSGRIAALKARKTLLEMQIKDELKRPKPSNDVLTPLKLDKLCIKQEIQNINRRF